MPSRFGRELSFDNDRSCIESSDIPNQSTSGNEFQTDLGVTYDIFSGFTF